MEELIKFLVSNMELLVAKFRYENQNQLRVLNKCNNESRISLVVLRNYSFSMIKLYNFLGTSHLVILLSGISHFSLSLIF